jgi:3-oxoacyl-[acyl-carrier protein] reductase
MAIFGQWVGEMLALGAVAVLIGEGMTNGGGTMDLGIAGKRALVCASSKGLGLGCAEALAEAGVHLVMNARGSEALEASAQTIRGTHGVEVVTVAADVATPEGQAAVIAAARGVDILVNNAGGPPPGMWPDWDRDDFIRALDANMLAPIALMTALMPGMIDRGWGRVVNITSQSVRAPIAVLGLSNAARTGLTGYVAGTARQVAGKGVNINNLLPGIHATDRADALDAGVVKAQGISLEEARAARAATIPAGRYGTRAEFGAACAFLCSQHAGYIVGQNILLDGGGTNLTM